MNILSMQGLSINMIINPLGGLGVTSQHDKLLQDIQTLLLTRRGTVIGNPSYGSYLHDILFELGSTSTIERVKNEISQVLLDNYNFIDETLIECSMEKNNLHVSITYTTINVNLSTRLEFNIPLASEGGILYE